MRCVFLHVASPTGASALRSSSWRILTVADDPPRPVREEPASGFFSAALLSSARIRLRMLGHSTIAITMDLYSHATPSLQAEAATKLDAALQSAFAGASGAVA